MRIASSIGLLVICGMVLAAVGCGKDTPDVKYKEYKGRVKEINLSANEVTVEVLFEDDGKYHPFTGKMAPDCEILIDGKTAEPEDVRIDDYIKLTVRVEKRDGERYRVAKKVEVIDREPAGTAPASQ